MEVAMFLLGSNLEVGCVSTRSRDEVDCLCYAAEFHCVIEIIECVGSIN